MLLLFSPLLRMLLLLQLVLLAINCALAVWHLLAMYRGWHRIEMQIRSLDSRRDDEPPATIPFRPRGE